MKNVVNASNQAAQVVQESKNSSDSLEEALSKVYSSIQENQTAVLSMKNDIEMFEV